nr:RHS repeat-associated core domain-containing protein [Clostridia bacterium]
YDAIGRVSSRTVTAAGHAFATAYGYVAGNNGSGNTTTLISSLTQTGESFTYTYDDVGNIASVVQNNKTTAYTYDALGQLIRVDDENDTTSGTAGTTWTYEYDRGGNILEKKRYAYTTGTLGTALETVTYTYDTTWKDKLVGYGNTTIEYDNIGNPTKAGTKTGEVWGSDTWYFTWEKGRQLKQMVKSGTTAAFKYNSEGLRVQKTVNNVVTNYTLHGKNIVHMTQGSNSLHFFYDASNRPAIVEWNNGVTAAKYAYIQNLQGDIVGIVDSNGTEVVKYTYDAWGKVLSATGSLASTLGTVQPFRYKGYVYDVETGLYYLRSRYYRPELYRFVSADALINTNLFGYCGNNPICRVDSSGRDWRSFWEEVGQFFTNLFRDIRESNEIIVMNQAKVDYQLGENIYSAVVGAADCVKKWLNNYATPMVLQIGDSINSVFVRVGDWVKHEWEECVKANQMFIQLGTVMEYNFFVNFTHAYSDFTDKYDIFGKWVGKGLEIVGISSIVKKLVSKFPDFSFLSKTGSLLFLERETIVYILKDAKPINIMLEE